MSNQIEQIPAKNEQEIAEIAELAPSCDFCHYSDLIEREEWCKEKFRHFFVAGMLAERERLMKEAVDGTIKFDRVIPNRYAVFAEVNPKKFKPGKEVGVIIIKKEK